MKKRIISIAVFLIIIILKTNGQETTLRWGLIGEKNNFVVDETEILVIEWLEYIFYNDLDKYQSYILDRNCVYKNLTNFESQSLLNDKINPALKPDSMLLMSTAYGFLFNKSHNKILMNFRDGLKGQICIPVDTLELHKLMKKLEIKTSKKALYAILTLPITGISYKQAVEFCNWRNKYEKLKYEYLLKSGEYSNEIHEFYTFSLPSNEEFALYNTNMDSISETKKVKYSTFNYKNSIKRNVIKYPYCKYGFEPVTAFFKASENSQYRPKKFIYSGINNVQGNVAEMSIIKGISFGGSYYHYAYISYNGETVNYTNPEPWLGFRCIGKKMELNK